MEDDDSVTYELSDKDKEKLLMLQKMLEALTGKKFKFVFMDKLKLNKLGKGVNIQQAVQNAPAQQRAGLGS